MSDRILEPRMFFSTLDLIKHVMGNYFLNFAIAPGCLYEDLCSRQKAWD